MTALSPVKTELIVYENGESQIHRKMMFTTDTPVSQVTVYIKDVPATTIPNSIAILYQSTATETKLAKHEAHALQLQEGDWSSLDRWLHQQVTVVQKCEKGTFTVSGKLAGADRSSLLVITDNNGPIWISNFCRIALRAPPEDQTEPTSSFWGGKQQKETKKMIDSKLWEPQIRALLDFGKSADLTSSMLQANYLITGLFWSSAYTAIISRNLSTIYMLRARAVVRNETGTDFKGVNLTLVTGQLQQVRRLEASQPMYAQRRSKAAYESVGAPMAMAMPAAAPMAYLPEPTPSAAVSYEKYTFDDTLKFNLPMHGTAQVDLFTIYNLPTKPYFHFVLDNYTRVTNEQGIPFGVEYTLEKRASLPGQIRVYSAKSNGMLEIEDYLGADELSRKGPGQKTEVQLGTSQWIRGKYVMEELESVGALRATKQYRATVTLKNNYKKNGDGLQQASVRILFPMYGQKVDIGVMDCKTQTCQMMHDIQVTPATITLQYDGKPYRGYLPVDVTNLPAEGSAQVRIRYVVY